MSRILLCLLVSFALHGCVTTSRTPYDPKSFPVTLTQLFAQCQPADGSGRMSFVQNGQNNFSSEFDWKSQDVNHLNLEFVSAVGQTLMQISISDNTVDLQDRANLVQQLKFPKITVVKDKYLEIDGHFVPVRYDELGCLLGFKLPKNWMDNIVSARRDANDYFVEIEDSPRTMQLSIYDVSVAPAKKFCVETEWRRFLFFKSRSMFCVTLSQAKMAELHLSDQFMLRWVQSAYE